MHLWSYTSLTHFRVTPQNKGSKEEIPKKCLTSSPETQLQGPDMPVAYRMLLESNKTTLKLIIYIYIIIYNIIMLVDHWILCKWITIVT